MDGRGQHEGVVSWPKGSFAVNHFLVALVVVVSFKRTE